ncbi:MAG: DNA translocase FtsK [Tissierellaceae bacterium]|nr:DNA translocase FtsK [Tissierellaceae bacterium]
MSKTKTKRRTKKTKTQLSKDIIGSIIIAIGIIWIISLFSFQMGIIGSLLRGTTFLLMGFGGYFFPLLLISTGIFFVMDRFNKKELEKSIIVLILLLSLLVFLDGKNIEIVGFLDRIKVANSLSLLQRGGGIIGGFLGFFFYKLFGKIGGYIVLSSIFTICSLMLTDVKIKDIIKKISLSLKFNNNTNINSKVKQKKPTNPKPKIKSGVEQLEIDSEEIQIMDYNNNNKTQNMTVENKESKSLEEGIIISNHKNEDYIYTFPSINLLNSSITKKDDNEKKEILNNAKIIEETMNNFGIEATITQINRGPTITCYELSPSPGIKLSRIVSLSDNIALSLASSDIRIEAPIPGKSAVGIEVPNKSKDTVSLKEMLLTEEYIDLDSNIPLVLGKDVSGKPIVSSIDKMPHLLIAGATGSGKSVCINTIIMSIIYKTSPEDVKLMLIDPKVVELSIYNNIPHLLIPVVTDAKKASFALNWAVEEMEKRYKLFAQSSVRDMASYNSKQEKNNLDKLPSIVIIIDELADLMMVAAQEIEDYICRLAQMARAAGIYLIVATQRPSVDVITGTIKANIPSRISFAVSSQVDSRTILDMSGAEKLLGKGDMLFYPSFYSKPLRVQGAFVSDKEVETVVNFLKDNNQAEYDDDVIEVVQTSMDIELDDSDVLLPDAIKLVVDEGQASISLLQRRLKIGYTRAARLVDEMEARGVIGGYEGSKPRKVLITAEDLEDNDI